MARLLFITLTNLLYSVITFFLKLLILNCFNIISHIMKTSYTNLLKTFILFLILITSDSLYSQVAQEWTHRYTGPEASADSPNDVFIDNSGNMYATGQSMVGGGFFKFITVKFNSAGIRQWVTKYEGPIFSNNTGNAVTVDNSGNVYVTGFGRTAGGNYDVLTLKYNSSGVQQWIQIYNGTGNFDDFGTSIVVDESGFVYVGGYSFGSGTGYDFVLLKYTVGGASQWTQRWNGVSNGEENLKKIALASNGDVVLTGQSFSSTSSIDFMTIRYNPAGGIVWAQKYNGPLNGGDIPSSLCIDASGFIYVSGQSTGTGTGYDAIVVKYNSAGVEQWVGRYNGASSNDDAATSLAVDPAGNVFITGHTFITGGQYYNFATVKYNSSGAEQWARTYNGVESFYDKSQDIKVDAAGNSYITGQSIKPSDGTSDIVTIKYSSAGTPLWTEIYNGPGALDDIPKKLLLDNTNSPIILASSYSYFFRKKNMAPALDNYSPPEYKDGNGGNNFLALCGSSDYLLIKYSTNADLIYETRYDGSGAGRDESKALTADDSGNCYVTGISFDVATNFDYATLKYNEFGAPLWAARYDAGFNGVDKAVSVAKDANGFTYVTGFSQGSAGGYDIATIKYDYSGSQVWASRYNGAANGDDYGVGVAVDATGNVYVTGYSDGSATGKDYVTIKYNPAGAQQWAMRYNGSANSNDYTTAIVLDTPGNIYITGKVSNSGSQLDMATIKYNPSGSQVWASVYNGAANDSDEANYLSLDASGNVIVAGRSKSLSTGFDFATVKYNSAGVQQWATLHNGSAGGSDEITSVACDNNGNIIVTGASKNIVTDYDYATIKYNAGGVQQWISNYNGTASDVDIANSLCVDLAGNSYVTGFSEDAGTGLNFCTVKYSKDGIFKWEEKYNYIDNDSDQASVVRVNSAGEVFVTGYSTSADSRQDYFTIKYDQSKSIYLKALIEGLYDETANTMVPDTMKIYLRNSTAPYAIVDSSTSMLDNSGNGSFIFPNAQNGVNYFLVLKNSKTLETWSSSSMNFLSGNINYDFSTSLSQAYGNNLKQKGSKFCVYSGDVIKDGVMNLSDVLLIYNQASSFASGYNLGDLNGNNIVNLTDMLIVYNSSINFVAIRRP